MECFHKAEKLKRAKPTSIFDDVYDKPHALLEKQKKEMLEHIKLYNKEYPLELYEKF
jgi:2-oxoisovalerate dehydrogenase E1 component alpha subunit